MTRVDEFDSFYRSTSESALRVVYAVTGDRTVAHDVTVDAYRRAWRDWSKIRDHEPVRYVRAEAWKLAVLSRGTHPLRRRHEEDSDTELLDALAALPSDDRRLVVLMTLGSTDLDEAAAEVGVSDEEGIELVTTAITALEASTGQSIDELERRMNALGAVTSQLAMPPSADIRQKAVRGQRRNTVGLVLAALVAIVVGGLVVTEGDPLTAVAGVPYRERLGAESADLVLDAQQIDSDNLLTASQVSRLAPDGDWIIANTDEDTGDDTPYATCPTQRFATENPLKVFVRTFESAGSDRVAQSIEVAASPSEAADAYQRLVSWYADCTHPRVQLVETYRVERPFGDFTIMRLVSHRSPERTFTVGFSQSGTVASTVVHEVDGLVGPPIEEFAQTLNDSVERVCVDSGGNCSEDITVTPADPPATSQAPAFLGIVDLPPIAAIDEVWAGTTPTTDAAANPASTVCDGASFALDGVVSASRIYVIPEATTLPVTFGVVETVGTFPSTEAATAFFDQVQNTINACSADNLAATAAAGDGFGAGPEFRGATWQIVLEVEGGPPVSFRSAIVQRDAAVAQVLFTPSGDTDITPQQFAALAQRAAQRLVHATPLVEPAP